MMKIQIYVILKLKMFYKIKGM